MVRPPCFMRAPLGVQKELGTQRKRSRPNRTESEAEGHVTLLVPRHHRSSFARRNRRDDRPREFRARKVPWFTRCHGQPPKRSLWRCIGVRVPTEVEAWTPPQCSGPLDTHRSESVRILRECVSFKVTTEMETQNLSQGASVLQNHRGGM
jgi:hypothetical protein